MPPTPSFCEKQNTDGIVPPHAQNVKNETFTKIKSRKTQAFVEQAEIFTNRYFFLAARGQLCYTKPVPTAGGVRLRRAVFCTCPCIVDSSCRGLATKVQTSEAFPTCLRRPYLFSRKREDRKACFQICDFATSQTLRANSPFVGVLWHANFIPPRSPPRRSEYMSGGRDSHLCRHGSCSRRGRGRWQGRIPCPQ